MSMDTELKAKWVEALRSGKYKKGTSFLVNDSEEYCCLGVLMDIQGIGIMKEYPNEDDRCTCDLPLNRVGGLNYDECCNLAAMNDGTGNYERPRQFVEIADYIEANL